MGSQLKYGILSALLLLGATGCKKGLFTKKPADKAPVEYEKEKSREYPYEYGSAPSPAALEHLPQLGLSQSMFQFAEGVEKQSRPCQKSQNLGASLRVLAQVAESVCLAEADSNSVWFGTKYQIDTRPDDVGVPTLGVWIDDSKADVLAVNLCTDGVLSTVVQVDKPSVGAEVVQGRFRELTNEHDAIGEFRFPVTGQAAAAEGSLRLLLQTPLAKGDFQLTPTTGLTLGNEPVQQVVHSRWNCAPEKILKFAATSANTDYVAACRQKANKVRALASQCGL